MNSSNQFMNEISSDPQNVITLIRRWFYHHGELPTAGGMT